MQYLLTMIAALALAACSMGQDLSSGGTAVDDFHRKLDAGQSAAIEASAAPEITSMNGGFAAVLDQIHRRLGKVKSSTRTGFNDTIVNGDHRLELTYDTKFERGDGAEEFVFRIVGGKPILAGYHIKSDAMKGNF